MLKFTDELISLVLHPAQTWLNMQIWWNLCFFFLSFCITKILTQNLILIWYRRTVDTSSLAVNLPMARCSTDDRCQPHGTNEKTQLKAYFTINRLTKHGPKSVGRGDSIKRNCVITASSKTNTGRQKCRRQKERMKRRRDEEKNTARVFDGQVQCEIACTLCCIHLN